MTELEKDVLYDEAVKIVTKGKTASVSALQRMLKIGYNRAATLMQAMESAGIILPVNAKGVREVIKQPAKKKASPKKKAAKKKSPPGGKKKATPKKPAQKPVKKKAAARKKSPIKNTSVVDEFGLSLKEREFADMYRGGEDAVRGNAKRCYMKVHPKATEGTAEVNGSKMLRKAKLDDYLKMRSEEISDACDVNAKWLLDRLIEEANADLADLYNESGGMKPIHEWPIEWRRGLVTGVEIKQEYIYMEGEQVPDGFIVKIKQPGRDKIKEMIGKHVDIQAFKEKLEVDLKGGLADRMARSRQRKSDG